MGLHFRSETCFLCGNSRKKYNKLAGGECICPDCAKPLETGVQFYPGRKWSKRMEAREVIALRNLQARQNEFAARFAPDYTQGEFQADSANGLFRAMNGTLIFPLELIQGYAECYVYSESRNDDGNTTTTYAGSCVWIALEGLPSLWCRWSPKERRKLFEREKTAQARWREALQPVMTYLQGVTGRGPDGVQSVTR